MLISRLFERLLGRKSAPVLPQSVPTLVHVTHAKAGSTWLDGIFRKLYGPLVAPRGRLSAEAAGTDLEHYVFPPGRIYPALFINRTEFNAHPELRDALRFVVIRDLRDTLVSLYYSLKVSHVLMGDIERQRTILNGLSKEDGLFHCLREQMHVTANLQRSWLGGGELIYKYEDLLQNDVALLRELLIGKFQLPISPARLEEVVVNNRFEKRFKRPLGSVDVASHGRQGAPGDWRRHFTPAVAAEFAERFGDLLIETGYELDHSWVKDAHGPAEDPLPA